MGGQYFYDPCYDRKKIKKTTQDEKKMFYKGSPMYPVDTAVLL